MKQFYILMIPLPPKSTLFPYTTLFRSKRRVLEHRHVQGVGREARDVNGAVGRLKASVLRDGLAVERANREREEAGGVGRGRDRRLDESRAVSGGVEVEEVACGTLLRAALR